MNGPSSGDRAPLADGRISALTGSEPCVENRFIESKVLKNPTPASTERELWLTHTLLLVCLLAIVAAKAVVPASSADEDFWWHLRTGDWILQHHLLPKQDFFSTYTIGKPWIAYTWLFDILSSRIYYAFGLHGILVFTTTLTLGFISGVVYLLSRYGRTPRAIVIGALVFWASAGSVSPRPWLFTFIFVVGELYCLLEARERGKLVWLAPIIPLFVLWANLHIQFVYGLGILGLFALERPLTAALKWPLPDTSVPTRWLWTTLVLSVLATLVNPYGWRIYTVVLQYATQTAPLSVVNEMQAMQFRSTTDWAALLLACWALFAIGSARRRSVLLMSLLVSSLWFGFHVGRDVWFLAVISALVIAHSGNTREAGLGGIRKAQTAIALPVALALAFAVLQSRSVSAQALQEAAAKRFPVDASTYIHDHALPGPLYNPYGWGGYLMWRLPEMPVSIDGRANLQGDDRLARFVATWRGESSWAEDPELRKAKTILLERDSPLASILRSDSRFHEIYRDKIASVFQPIASASRHNRD